MMNVVCCDDVWQLDPCVGANWIFPECPENAVNQYVDFIHDFDSGEIHQSACLRISADTDFAVWLNGQFVGHGQYSNYPNAKTYEMFDVSKWMLPGRNRLAITVFYNGRTSSVYQRGEPGLLFEICVSRDCLAISGAETRCRCNPCYHSGPIAIVSGQLAYTFGYDAQEADDFQSLDYDLADAWRFMHASEINVPNSRVLLNPRPVAQLVDGGITDAHVIERGTFRFDPVIAESEFGAAAHDQTLAGLVLADGSVVSPGWQIHRAVLLKDCASVAQQHDDGACSISPDTPLISTHLSENIDLPVNSGEYIIVDLGQQEVGHLELEIDAPAGTLVDIGYGEHLDDGRVRSFVGGRSFAGRYICGHGRQLFCHRYLRWAGRYLQIHVHGAVFKLYRLGLRRREYPVAKRADLMTGNTLHHRIFDVGCRTLHLCMHEHYEDTPWREQALYANDARTQALCGYYAFGETAMPSASMSLLGHGLREDGFINLTAPAKPPLTIPSFTFAWMLAVRDYHLFSGDDRLSKQFLPQIKSMLNRFLAELQNGLLPLRQAKGIWHFYDWSGGMSGYRFEAFAAGLDADLPLNAYLILSLEAALQMQMWCDIEPDQAFVDAANVIREEAAERFWLPSENAFVTHQQADDLTELTQSLAVLSGIGDECMRAKALERLGQRDSGLLEPGLSQSFYTFEALMSCKDRYGIEVLRRIETTWGRMLENGATTFWETVKGASDFSNAGSLCHGWSAVPVYVLFHDVLGLYPLTPGFKSFALDPLFEIAPEGRGCVPVPGGEIQASWTFGNKGSADVEVKAPCGCKCVR